MIPITLPAFLQRKPKKYITKAGGQYTPDDIALRFALCLRIHGTADSIRQTAWEIAPKVCYEHQPNMKLLSRTKDDGAVFTAALNIINRVCNLLHIAPGQEFLRNEQLQSEPASGDSPLYSRDSDGRENWDSPRRCKSRSHRDEAVRAAKRQSAEP